MDCYDMKAFVIKEFRNLGRIKEVIVNGIDALMKIQYFGVGVFMIVKGMINAKINVLLNLN